MSQIKTRHISCHCQKHILKLEIPEDKFNNFGVCDCSHCLKRRIVWHSAPPGTLSVVKGVDGSKGDGVKLGEYCFEGKEEGHQFCKDCGTHLLGMRFDNDKEIMYNMRAIREEKYAVWNHPMTLYSGIDRGQPYKHITINDIPGASEYMEERQKAYSEPTEIKVGSCRCQTIKFAVLTKPLNTVRLVDCGCSICHGNGALWIYPGRQNVIFHPRPPSSPPYSTPLNITQYGYLKKQNLHYHCTKCGNNIFEYAIRPTTDPRPTEGFTEEQIKNRPAWIAENGFNGSFGLNLMLISDIGDYLGDVHNLIEGQKGYKEEWKRLPNLKREENDLINEPLYQLKL